MDKSNIVIVHYQSLSNNRLGKMSEHKRYESQVINDEILQKLSLRNRYNFVNDNLRWILRENQFNFLNQVQEFCLNYEKKNEIIHGPDEDIYDWVPDFGKEGLVSRAHPYDEIDMDFPYNGLVTEFMRLLSLSFFDPMFSMAMGATSLAINPVYAHHENIPIRLEILKKFVTGETPGAILITEPERGSDAVHMLTTCNEQEDGSFLLNGEKIYNTNAPKSDYVVAYATAEKNNGNTMAQFLIDTSWDGWECKRVMIPWVNKIWIGHEYFTNLRVPKEYVLGGIGKGREHLFEGLSKRSVVLNNQYFEHLLLPLNGYKFGRRCLQEINRTNLLYNKGLEGRNGANTVDM